MREFFSKTLILLNNIFEEKTKSLPESSNPHAVGHQIPELPRRNQRYGTDITQAPASKIDFPGARGTNNGFDQNPADECYLRQA